MMINSIITKLLKKNPFIKYTLRVKVARLQTWVWLPNLHGETVFIIINEQYD